MLKWRIKAEHICPYFCLLCSFFLFEVFNVSFFFRDLPLAILQDRYWRSKWQPTPVLLPGKFHGQKSLVGYSPWGHKELDTTERLHFTQDRYACDELSLFLSENVFSNLSHVINIVTGFTFLELCFLSVCGKILSDFHGL